MREKMSNIQVVPLLKKTGAEWSEDKASKMAASLAYYTATSIAPMVIAALGVFTLFVHKHMDPVKLKDTLTRLSDKSVADTLQTTIDKAATGNSGLIATLVGSIVAAFSASAVFGELQDSLNTIWEVKPKPNRGIKGIIKDRFLTLSMVFGIAFLLLVSTVLTGVVGGVSGTVVGRFTGGHISAGVAQSILIVITFILNTGVITVLFAGMFKLLPDVIVAWRDVWLGAFLTSLMFQLGKLLLTLYITYFSPGSAFGAAGTVVIMLVWVYYSAQILFFGAEFTQVFANQYGSRAVPSANAEPLTEDMRAQAGIAHKPDSPSHPDNVRRANKPPRRMPVVSVPPKSVPSTAGKNAVLAAAPVAVGLVLGRLAWLRYKGRHVQKVDIQSGWQDALGRWKKVARLFGSSTGRRYALTHGPAGKSGPAWADLAESATPKR